MFFLLYFSLYFCNFAALFYLTTENKDPYNENVPFGADWQPGKRYIYTLIFGGGYNAQGQAILQPINFKAEVGKWEDADATINVNK